MRQKGFTLIEVLLAMAITAFVALIAYNGLTVAANGAERHQQQAEQMAALQLALSILERDIRDSVMRGITDEYGDPQAAMLGGNQQSYPLQLTRSGWHNPLEQRRAALQRVRYVLENEALWRESWLVLDRVNEEEGQQKTLLLSGVESLELRFLDSNSAAAEQSDIGGEWIEDWPPQGGVLDSLPLAIELQLELETAGQIRRVIAIASAS